MQRPIVSANTDMVAKRSSAEPYGIEIGLSVDRNSAARPIVIRVQTRAVCRGVARSVKLSRGASDVGFGKHVYKIGVTEGDPKALAEAGWAGESDWKIVRRESVEGLGEAEALERLSRKEKPIDPNLYPKLKGALGVE